MTAQLNVTIFEWLHSGAGHRPPLDGLAVFFAEGGPYLLAVLFALLWFFQGREKKSTLLEATEAAVIALMINQFIGLVYFHPRPYMVGLCTPLFPHGPETSFPSDHATVLFAAALYILWAGRWAACGLPVLVIACMTSWGRVYTGIHFPFDIVGSLVVGVVSAGLVHWFARSLSPLNTNLIRISDSLVGRVVRLRHGDGRRR